MATNSKPVSTSGSSSHQAARTQQASGANSPEKSPANRRAGRSPAAAAPSAPAATRRSAAPGNRAAAGTRHRPGARAGPARARSWSRPHPRQARHPAHGCRRRAPGRCAARTASCPARSRAEAVGGELPARLVAVQEGALQLGPQVGGTRADRRGRDEPGAGRPGRKQPVDVVARQQHIAVGDDDPGVARRPPALDDVVELGVLGHAVVADQQARLDVRMLRDQPLHQRHDRVLRGPAAQQDFQLRIVELEGRAQRRFLEGVEPAHRPDDGDRRPLLEIGRGCGSAERRQRQAVSSDVPTWISKAATANAPARCANSSMPTTPKSTSIPKPR